MNKNEEQSRNYPLQENMPWQRLEWRLQKVGVMVLFLIVIGGACGLFSKGFISEQQAASADKRVVVEYERFGRQQSTMDMAIRLKGLQGSRFSITLNGAAIDNFQLQTIQPQPLLAHSEGHNLTLTWLLPASQSEASIWLTWQPLSYGTYHAGVTLNGASSVAFDQFIYP